MEHRPFSTGDILPASFINAFEQFIGPLASPNFVIAKSSATTLQIVGGIGNAQVGIGISGAYRYNTATISATAPAASAGDYNIYVTSRASDTAGEDLGTFDYSFGLKLNTAPSGSGAEAISRIVGTYHWDGSTITKVTQTVGTGPPDGLQEVAAPRTLGFGHTQAMPGDVGVVSHAPTHKPTYTAASDPIDYTFVHLRGTLAARPSSGLSGYNGLTYFATDDNGGTVYRCNGTAWEKQGRGATETFGVTKTFWISHTYAVQGNIAPPAGESNYLPPFRVPAAAGQTVKLARVDYRLDNGASGVSATFDLRLRSGGTGSSTTVTGFGSLTAGGATNTNAWVETDPTDVTLSDKDELIPVITSTSGLPQNISIVFVLEHTV